MKRRQVSLHYCNSCRITTRHTETETTSTCLRCGTVKCLTRVVRSLSNPEREQNRDPGWN